METRRFPGLDSMRGVAAALVVALHLREIRSGFLDCAFFGNGYYWVDFFFILSGFVVSDGYLSRIRTRANALDFMKTRFFRIYPLHILTTLVFIGLDWLRITLHAAPGTGAFGYFTWARAREAMSSVLLLTSMGINDHSVPNFPSWSVSAEFYAYVAFCGVLLACRARKRVELGAVSLLVSAASYAIVLKAGGTLDRTYDFGFLRCLGGFFLGVASYLGFSAWDRKAPGVKPGNFGPLLTLAVIIGLLSTERHDATIAVLVVCAFASFIVSIALGSGDSLPNRVLRASPLRWLGERSYSIYMLQAFLIVPAKLASDRLLGARLSKNYKGHAEYHLGDGKALAVYLVTYVSLLALSDLAYRKVESRFRVRRRRAEPPANASASEAA